LHKQLRNSIFFKVLFVIITGIFAFDIFFSFITGSSGISGNTMNQHGYNTASSANLNMISNSKSYYLANPIANIEYLFSLFIIIIVLILVIRFGLYFFAYYNNNQKNK